ncbi:hypothetical protein AB0M39_16135 [Streptomyces sp. NPDC051907]|uniref:hypothetical protein n=1 Tax=Streptomyces sp. NPDC051907 TaxID=3155284 RepID=UPI00342DBAC6
MTTADAVRRRLGLGRLLPLGGAEDGAWMSERAAAAVLWRAATAEAPAVVPGRLRVGLADPEAATAPAFPPPPGALPPGPLRIEAEFAARAHEPLRPTASALREALLRAADELLGLVVATVDLRVTDVVDHAPQSPTLAPPPEVTAAPAKALGTPTATSASQTPGVAHLTATLGAPVHLADDHVRVELATAAGHRALDVARAVRAAVTPTLTAPRPVTILISASL